MTYATELLLQIVSKIKRFFSPSLEGWGGGDTPVYGLYRYVPLNRVWFLRFSVG